MRKCILILAVICGLYSCSSGIGKSKNVPVYVEYFKVGDTLPPDMVCPDTLIVVDVVGLNKGWGLMEQGFVDYTDYQIDSVLHTNCKIIKP